MRAGDEFAGTVGHYTIEAVLHVSSQLITARAHDADGRPVVLKQLRLDRLQSWKVLELFERETRILKQLDHPQLPRYLDTFQIESDADTCLYLVCSWAEGESLLDKLAADWQPSQDEVWEIARQTLEILSYLHAFNPAIIHRDLKPGNLILSAEGVVRLVDLGAVQGVLNPDGGSTVVGTFGYMPPEQFSDQSVPATDLYALGATLLHLLTGRYPSDLPRKGMKIQLPANLPLAADGRQWLDKLLAPEVEDRFQSAAQALASLAQKADASPLAEGQGRIRCFARGTQLKIEVAALGWRRALGYQGLFLIWLTLCWALRAPRSGEMLYGYRSYSDFGDVLISAEPWLAKLGDLMLLGWDSAIVPVWALLTLGLRLVSARIMTRLSLQPDRYQLVHALGPLRWRLEGMTSELGTLRRRYSWLFAAAGLKLIEKNQLQHIGSFHINRFEVNKLTQLIADYLALMNPRQAEALAQTSVSAMQKGLSERLARVWNAARIDLRLNLADLQNKLRQTGSKWLPQQLGARFAGSARMQIFASADGLRIEIARRRLSWLSAGVTGLALAVSVMYFSALAYLLFFRFIYHPFASWMLYGAITDPSPSFTITHPTESNTLTTPATYLLGQLRTFLSPWIVLYLVTCPVLLRLGVKRVLAGLIKTSLDLTKEKIELREDLCGFKRQTEIPLKKALDLQALAGPLRERSGNLILTDTEGASHTLAYWLHPSETRALVLHLQGFYASHAEHLGLVFNIWLQALVKTPHHLEDSRIQVLQTKNQLELEVSAPGLNVALRQRLRQGFFVLTLAVFSLCFTWLFGKHSDFFFASDALAVYSDSPYTPLFMDLLVKIGIIYTGVLLGLALRLIFSALYFAGTHTRIRFDSESGFEIVKTGFAPTSRQRVASAASLTGDFGFEKGHLGNTLSLTSGVNKSKRRHIVHCLNPAETQILSAHLEQFGREHQLEWQVREGRGSNKQRASEKQKQLELEGEKA